MCAANTSTRPPPDSLARDMATSALRSRCPGCVPAGQGHADAGGQRDIPVGDPERLGGDAPASRSAMSTISCALVALSTSTANSSPPQRATISLRRHRGPQPPRGLGQQQVARAVPDGVVHAGEAVQVDEDRAGLGRRLTGLGGPVDGVLGPLLEVGPVRQAGEAVVEGQVRDLPAQRDLVADVPRGDQQPVGAGRVPVPGHGRLHVPPGAVGRPDPAGEPAG